TRIIRRAQIEHLRHVRSGCRRENSRSLTTRLWSCRRKATFAAPRLQILSALPHAQRFRPRHLLFPIQSRQRPVVLVSRPAPRQRVSLPPHRSLRRRKYSRLPPSFSASFLALLISSHPDERMTRLCSSSADLESRPPAYCGRQDGP